MNYRSSLRSSAGSDLSVDRDRDNRVRKGANEINLAVEIDHRGEFAGTVGEPAGVPQRAVVLDGNARGITEIRHKGELSASGGPKGAVVPDRRYAPAPCG